MTKPLFVALMLAAIIAMSAGTPLFYSPNHKLAGAGIVMAFGGLALFLGSVLFALLA